MTCKEKFLLEHNGDEHKLSTAILCNCPSHYGYLEDPHCLGAGDESNISCDECWSREIPEVTDNLKKTGEAAEKTSFAVTDVADALDDLKNLGIYLSMTSNRTKVLCISGKAQHGKDTTAGFLREYLEENGKRVLIAHYGDLVKYVCTTFFGWDGNKDEAGRTLLQEVGTDRVRTKSPNFWVKFIRDILDHFPDKWDYVLIPDTRFPNEIDFIREGGYDVRDIRVIRSNFISPLTIEQQKHISETILDNRIPDYLIYNGFGLEELRESVRSVGEIIVNKHKPEFNIPEPQIELCNKEN